MSRTFDATAYQKTVSDLAPKSKAAAQCVQACWTGGLICAIGQALHDAFGTLLHLSENEANAWTSISLILLAAVLTGLGWYDRIGAYAGAGSVVPITGFANSIVSPAIEFKSEGLILGTGAKLFTIAGPVLVYGIGASIVVGLLSLLF